MLKWFVWVTKIFILFEWCTRNFHLLPKWLTLWYSCSERCKLHKKVANYLRPPHSSLRLFPTADRRGGQEGWDFYTCTPTSLFLAECQKPGEDIKDVIKVTGDGHRLHRQVIRHHQYSCHQGGDVHIVLKRLNHWSELIVSLWIRNWQPLHHEANVFTCGWVSHKISM